MNNLQQFYCNICKKIISKGAFMYSMDKFGKALCLEHQKQQKNYKKPDTGLNDHTKRIQEMMKRKNKVEFKTNDDVEMTDIKDWINSDIDTWKKALSKNK